MITLQTLYSFYYYCVQLLVSWFGWLFAEKKYVSELQNELTELRELMCQNELHKKLNFNIELMEKKSKFNKNEIKALYRGFKQFYPNGVVTKIKFLDIFTQLFPFGDPRPYAEHVFRVFDSDQNGYINFEEFIVGISNIMRGSMHEKLKWTWRLYDPECNGYITWCQLYDIIHAMSCMIEPRAPFQFDVALQKEFVGCFIDDELRQHTQAVFQKLDLEKNGIISEHEFVAFCLNDPTIKTSFEAFRTVRDTRSFLRV